MSSVFYRIDDRLIHGQVITGWSRFYQLKRIIILDDSVANDPVQQQIISLVAPSDINVYIESIEDGAQAIQKSERDGASTLVLVKGPHALLELVNKNVSVDKVVVGGMQFKSGRNKITNTVSATEEEASTFKVLSGKGVDIVYQVIPTDKEQDFIHLLKVNS